jgi:hypothetical protein
MKLLHLVNGPRVEAWNALFKAYEGLENDLLRLKSQLVWDLAFASKLVEEYSSLFVFGSMLQNRLSIEWQKEAGVYERIDHWIWRLKESSNEIEDEINRIRHSEKELSFHLSWWGAA